MDVVSVAMNGCVYYAIIFVLSAHVHNNAFLLLYVLWSIKYAEHRNFWLDINIID